MNAAAAEAVGPAEGQHDGRTKASDGAIIPRRIFSFLRVALFLCATLSVGWHRALADEHPDCALGRPVLWGDGEHDDTLALNAWLRGESVVWAKTLEPVGPVIAGRSFRLSEAIYVRSGTGRTLEWFRLIWPERGEVVSGDSLVTGSDPDQPPAGNNVNVTGGDPDEGVAFDAPDPAPDGRSDPSTCAIS
jgi:hypothetical protein